MTSLPEWAKLPFNRCLEYNTEVDRILSLCMQGLSQITALPELARVLAETDDGSISPDKLQHLADTQARAEFAKAEMDTGFPTLHAHSIIAIWSALEALVADVATAWLRNEPTTLSGDRFARLKIPLAEYEGLNKEERMAFLVTEYSRSVNADFRPGIGKFEVLLEAIGLDGIVEEHVRRDLYELSQMRNLLVHRAGVVDRRFKASCPWLSYEIGDKIRIDHALYTQYTKAVHDYILTLINRVRGHFGMDPYAPAPPASGSAKGTSPVDAV